MNGRPHTTTRQYSHFFGTEKETEKDKEERRPEQSQDPPEDMLARPAAAGRNRGGSDGPVPLDGWCHGASPVTALLLGWAALTTRTAGQMCTQGTTAGGCALSGEAGQPHRCVHATLGNFPIKAARVQLSPTATPRTTL